jgi:hypothetical protein
MRAHQPGSTPIDIPETVPNPAHTPAPAPAPERAPTKAPEKVPEKGNRPGVIQGFGGLLQPLAVGRRHYAFLTEGLEFRDCGDLL